MNTQGDNLRSKIREPSNPPPIMKVYSSVRGDLGFPSMARVTGNSAHTNAESSIFCIETSHFTREQGTHALFPGARAFFIFFGGSSFFGSVPLQEVAFQSSFISLKENHLPK